MSRRFVPLVMLVAASLVACGGSTRDGLFDGVGDDDLAGAAGDPAQPTAGTGGDAPIAGAGGSTGGSSPVAGKGGSAGMPTAGTGGQTAGSSGTGGAPVAGTGGSIAGSAGAPVAGSGGSVGGSGGAPVAGAGGSTAGAGGAPVAGTGGSSAGTGGDAGAAGALPLDMCEPPTDGVKVDCGGDCAQADFGSHDCSGACNWDQTDRYSGCHLDAYASNPTECHVSTSIGPDVTVSFDDGTRACGVVKFIVQQGTCSRFDGAEASFAYRDQHTTSCMVVVHPSPTDATPAFVFASGSTANYWAEGYWHATTAELVAGACPLACP